MSMYTTGEIAKLCCVTVRTVQYYDTRGILVPSELSEGGRRLYSEEDVKKLKIICFLKNLGLPLESITQLFKEEHPENTISVLIEQQEQALQTDLKETESKIGKLKELKRELKTINDFSVESIGDIAYIMENKKQLKKVHSTLLLTGIPVSAFEIFTIVWWIITGIYWPFVCYLFVAIIYGIIASKYYFTKISYICPECHSIFKPTIKEAFFAKHTPVTRKLTCTCCNHNSFCIEVCVQKGLS